MKLNEYVEVRPPRSQQYYNRVYLGLIAGLVLVVFVLFPKRGMEFKRYLSFDQQKGDVIYVKSSSRIPSRASRTDSAEAKKQYPVFPSMTIVINDKNWYCQCYFNHCYSRDYFNNPPNSRIPDDPTRNRRTTMIESIEVLQTNRYRYCVVSKMRYLGEDYDLNAAYNGHGKIFLQDERLRNIEPIRYVHYRVLAYTIFAISLFMNICFNVIDIKKDKGDIEWQL
ncbi:hypothetical protein [Cardiobacterium sp. Marseille-Q4385]|uniref:hypothetical protein n=1 Tax=Cardiobacterium sp. Marseille-Q4385 TaxID=2866573 RepID=UPI001CE4415E|nr:hypothetical protein [Cardiobacterium sp. Marseille-Q4385]